MTAKPLAAAQKASSEKALPKAGEKVGIVMTILGMTSLFASVKLFRKGREGQ